MALLLTKKLLARGWSWDLIRPIFHDAHYFMTNTNPKIKLQKPTMQPIIIHSTYHPRGIQCQDLREIFMQTLGQEISNPIIIAQARPYNFKNRLR